MKIGVISDSHGERLMLDRVAQKFTDISMFVHLGDLCTDAVYLHNITRVPVEYVCGNCDFTRRIPNNKEIEVGGKRIFLTHGHLYRVKWGTRQLVNYAREKQYDAVLFGHTHRAEIFKENGTIFMNPGSLSQSRGYTKATIGILEILEDRLVPHIVKID
ncbi:MAG: metallophosphoesterase [Clostridiales bacterium]|mgnify:CR=1 FL=1|jgi:putative phosphoesterase|nr:metallophosphoesterase [Clostridiales bacterium]